MIILASNAPDLQKNRAAQEYFLITAHKIPQFHKMSRTTGQYKNLFYVYAPHNIYQAQENLQFSLIGPLRQITIYLFFVCISPTVPMISKEERIKI